MIISKKFFKRAIIIGIFAIALFCTIYFGIKVRQLELEEIAEQIEKFGFYKSDIHINLERNKLSLKYEILMVFPLLTTFIIGALEIINDIFFKKDNKYE